MSINNSSPSSEAAVTTGVFSIVLLSVQREKLKADVFGGTGMG